MTSAVIDLLELLRSRCVAVDGAIIDGLIVVGGVHEASRVLTTP